MSPVVALYVGIRTVVLLYPIVSRRILVRKFHYNYDKNRNRYAFHTVRIFHLYLIFHTDIL
jgi:hypothetical protein